jgi:hypothetical protein
MATITSAQSGNFSDTDTWVGGVVPTSVDDVILTNQHTILADIDILVNSITGAATQGRLLIETSRNITVTDNITAGNISNNTTYWLIVITAPEGETVNIIANVISTQISQDRFRYAIQINGAAQINITCPNILGGGFGPGGSYNNFSGAAIHVSSGIGTTGGVIIPVCNLSIIGNIYGAIVSPSTQGSTTIIIRAELYNISFVGNVIGSDELGSGRSVIFQSGGNGNIDINGIVQGTSLRHCIISNSLKFSGIVMKPTSGTINPLYCTNLDIYGFTEWQFQSKSMYTAGVPLGNPATTEVRSGYTYGPNEELTGTLAVPTASAVAVGVPVDNTTGTAIITVTDMGALLSSFKIS